MDDKQVTTNEIMEFLRDHTVSKSEFSGLKDESHSLMGFLQEHMVVKEEFQGLRDQVENLDSKVQSIDSRVQTLEVKVNQVKLDLIDAMDEKLGSLKGDLVVMMRSEDTKLNSLVHLLAERKVLDETSVHSILTMKPFPQLFVTH